MGKFLGSKSEKSGNVATLVIALCFIFLFVAFFALRGEPASSVVSFEKIFTALLGVVALALGYLFGSGGNKQ